MSLPAQRSVLAANMVMQIQIYAQIVIITAIPALKVQKIVYPAILACISTVMFAIIMENALLKPIRTIKH